MTKAQCDVRNEAVDCLTLCQQLFSEEWRLALKALPLIMAYEAGVIEFGEMETVLGPQFVFKPLGNKLIAAGVKLARGE